MSTQADILDNKILQDLQDSYVSTLPVYAWCYRRPYERLTAFSAEKEAEAFFASHISEDAKKILVASFSDGSAEDVISAEADVPYITVCGVSIRDTAGNALGAWIFAGVCMELLPEGTVLPEGIACTTGAEFDHIIALIAKTSGMYFTAHGRRVFADEKLSVVSTTEDELADEKRRNAALGDIIKMLESDNDFGPVAADILHIAGVYLGLTDALLLRLDAQADDVDVVSDYAANEDDAVIGRFLRMKRREIPFLTEREYTVSSDSIMPDSFRDFFRKYGITAGVFLPLVVEDETAMYLCFIMRHESRKWKIKELSFLSEVKSVVRTILSARMTKNSLAATYATMDEVLENNAYGLVVAEKGKEEDIYVNERFGRMITDPKDMQNFRETFPELFRQDISDSVFYADAAKRWFEVHAARVRWMDGRDARMVTVNDITETKRYEQKIEEQAKTDFLTGLYNRQQFERDLSVAVKDALRGGDQGSFLYINLDDFKDVNGEYGHSFGDSLLCEAARALESICKAKATCYRIGGDEFGVLLPFYEYSELNKLVGTIQRRFEQSWSLGGAEYSCTMSMGVVCFPKDGADVGTLMRNADIALDTAKQNAPGVVEWYSKRDDQANKKRLELENSLREAVEAGCRAFVAKYEPLCDNAGEKEECLGAMVHIALDETSLAEAGLKDYLAAADYLGLRAVIDAHILKEALRHCRYWNDFGCPTYRVYVELSTQFMLRTEAASTVNKILDEVGINEANVWLGAAGMPTLREEAKFTATADGIKKTGVHFVEASGKKEAVDGYLTGEVLTAEEFEAKYME